MQGSSTTTPRRTGRDAAIGLAVLLVLLALLEGAARLTFWVAYRDEQRYAYSADTPGDLQPGQDGPWTLWSHRPYHVQTNAEGFRNAAPLREGRRILALGDSITFGPYLANEETWPAVLERRLRPGFDGQVVNAAVAGYTITDQAAYFAEKGHRLGAELTILAAFANDISDFRPAQRETFERGRGDGAPPLATLRLMNAAARRLRAAPQAGTDARYEEHLRLLYTDPGSPDAERYRREYARAFTTLAAGVRDSGGRLTVVYVPEWVGVHPRGFPGGPQAFLAALAAQAGVPFLDLTEEFRANGDVTDLYLLSERGDGVPSLLAGDVPTLRAQAHALTDYVGDGHLSARGSRLVAERIAAFIVEQRLLPGTP